MAQKEYYDHRIVNDSLQETVDTLIDLLESYCKKATGPR